MEVEINMINVEDGDAIIVILRDAGKSDVILIDAGEKHFIPRVKKQLDIVLAKEGGKLGPDLVICTHIDSDHIQGCIDIVNAYKNNIGELWVFEPSKYLRSNKKELVETYTSGMDKPGSSDGWANVINLSKSKLFTESYRIYESFSQLESLFALLKSIKFDVKKIKEPIRGLVFKKYPFIVLSPDVNFFKKCITDRNELVDNLKAMATRWKINRASVVCKLTNGADKYLFTGDAEISTLKNIQNYKTEINDLKFLDVPHHGSIANFNQELADLMKPKISFISAVNDTQHPAPNVKNWLKKHGSVYVTNEKKGTWYLELNKSGKIKIEPLV